MHCSLCKFPNSDGESLKYQHWKCLRLVQDEKRVKYEEMIDVDIKTIDAINHWRRYQKDRSQGYTVFEEIRELSSPVTKCEAVVRMGAASGEMRCRTVDLWIVDKSVTPTLAGETGNRRIHKNTLWSTYLIRCSNHGYSVNFHALRILRSHVPFRVRDSHELSLARSVINGVSTVVLQTRIIIFYDGVSWVKL